MATIPFSTRIDEAALQLLDGLVGELGPPKNRIIEVGIELFAALPTELQYILKSNRQEDRALCIDLIRKLGLPSRSKQPARKARPAKAQ